MTLRCIARPCDNDSCVAPCVIGDDQPARPRTTANCRQTRRQGVCQRLRPGSEASPSDIVVRWPPDKHYRRRHWRHPSVKYSRPGLRDPVRKEAAVPRLLAERRVSRRWSLGVIRRLQPTGHVSMHIPSDHRPGRWPPTGNRSLGMMLATFEIRPRSRTRHRVQ